MSMKKIVLIILFAVLAGGLLVVGMSQSEQSSGRVVMAEYTSEEFIFRAAEADFSVQYDDSRKFAQVRFEDSVYDLQRLRSASGARYESRDGSVVFWEQGNEAMLEVDGVTVVDQAMFVVNSPDSTPLALSQTSWEWIETIYNNDEVVLPSDPGAFILSFIDGDRFGAQTDCNNVAGTYILAETTITFNQTMTTKMACNNQTQEQEFSNMLGEVSGVMIDEMGQLVLMFRYDSGSMIFQSLPG